MNIDGDKLRQTRELKGITQNDLAQALDINRVQVSRWERGEMRCHPRHWKKIEKVLNVDILKIAVVTNFDPSKLPAITDSVKLILEGDMPPAISSSKLFKTVETNWDLLSAEQQLQILEMCLEAKDRPDTP